jgi:hypothetical protein
MVAAVSGVRVRHPAAPVVPAAPAALAAHAALRGAGHAPNGRGAGQARAGLVRHSPKAGRPTAKARARPGPRYRRTSTPGTSRPRSGAS